MFRFVLALLFFFSLLFKGNAQDYPILRAVSVDSAQIKISWLYDENKDSVTIIRSIDNIRFDPVGTFVITELEWIDVNASPLDSIYYYCTAWESLMSPVQNNMILDSVKVTDGCQNSASISWNNYNNMFGTLDHYEVLYRIKNNPPFPFECCFSTEKTNHTETLLKPNTYEFVVKAVSKIDTIFAFSNIVQITTGEDKTDIVDVKITDVSVSLINDKDIEIEVETNEFPFRSLYLYRETKDNSGIFDRIDSLLYDDKINHYTFIDGEALPHSKLYYYQVFVQHECKVADSSNIITNIHLSGERDVYDENNDKISFSQFGEPLSDTYFLLVNGNIHETFYFVNNTLTVNVSVEEFMSEGSEIIYQIKSEKGEYSNKIGISHEPVISFPTAFYPSANARDKDQTFYPIIDFASEDDYHFYIYNRWGQELFHATKPPVNGDYFNKETCWDGTFKGQDCPAGIYAYKISYTYNKGKGSKGKYADTGSVMLIR